MRKNKKQSGQGLGEKLDGLTEKVGALVKALNGMATKADLKTMVTKADLKTMATKADLKTMATKADLKTMATRADLKKVDAKINIMDARIDRMASKGDLENVMAKMVSKDHFDRAVRMLVTKVEFDGFKEYVTENMMTKGQFEERFDDFQDVLFEIRDYRENRILFQGQHADLQDTVAKHDQRIAVLEKKVL